MDFYQDFLKIKIKYFNVSIDGLDSGTDRKDFKFVLIDTDIEKYAVKSLEDITKKIDGKIALDSIDAAAEIVLDGNFKSIVTLPVSKENISFFEPSFRGHTEYFQKKME
jgi:4-hydroxy-L-threonine phosphate dehydrogenase PdxA